MRSSRGDLGEAEAFEHRAGVARTAGAGILGVVPAGRDEFVREATRAPGPNGDDALAQALSSFWDRGAAAWPGTQTPADLARAVADRVSAAEDPVGTLDALDAGELWLAAGCSSGDRWATRELESTLWPAVVPALAHLRLEAAALEDIKQITLQRLLTGAPQANAKILEYAGRGRLRALVKVVALRLGVDVIRRRTREPTESAAPDDWLVERLSTGMLSPESRAMKTEHTHAFKEAFGVAVQELSDRARGVLRLHVLHQCTIDEIGALHGVHRSTAARWIAEARDSIGNRVRRHLRSSLGLTSQGVESLLESLDSQLDLSLSRLLPRDPGS